MMGADQLVLLSDVDGLYTADPRRDATASHIPEVDSITPEIEAMAAARVSGLGRGGMAPSWCRHASPRRRLRRDHRQGRNASAPRGDARRRAPHDFPRQRDAGGRAQALDRGRAQTRRHIDDRRRRGPGAGEGKSLLPAGIRQVDGRFERGDAVLVRTGRTRNRPGPAAYNASDAERIAGKRTVEIEAILGYRGRDEMIHRDDLALTARGT